MTRLYLRFSTRSRKAVEKGSARVPRSGRVSPTRRAAARTCMAGCNGWMLKFPCGCPCYMTEGPSPNLSRLMLPYFFCELELDQRLMPERFFQMDGIAHLYFSNSCSLFCHSRNLSGWFVASYSCLKRSLASPVSLRAYAGM